jgi:hypothetical protein
MLCPGGWDWSSRVAAAFAGSIAAHTSRSGAIPTKCQTLPPQIGPRQPWDAQPNSGTGSLQPQLHRWAVITHSVPIMPPGLQLLRRLLTR